MTVKDFAVFGAASHVVDRLELWEECLDPDDGASANTPCRANGSRGAI